MQQGWAVIYGVKSWGLRVWGHACLRRGRGQRSLGLSISHTQEAHSTRCPVPCGPGGGSGSGSPCAPWTSEDLSLHHHSHPRAVPGPPKLVAGHEMAASRLVEALPDAVGDGEPGAAGWLWGVGRGAPGAAPAMRSQRSPLILAW